MTMFLIGAALAASLGNTPQTTPRPSPIRDQQAVRVVEARAHIIAAVRIDWRTAPSPKRRPNGEWARIIVLE